MAHQKSTTSQVVMELKTHGVNMVWCDCCNYKIRFSVLIDWIPTWTHYVNTQNLVKCADNVLRFCSREERVDLGHPEKPKTFRPSQDFSGSYLSVLCFSALVALLIMHLIYGSLLFQPTLIIWGEHDHLFPLGYAHKLKMWVSDAL